MTTHKSSPQRREQKIGKQQNDGKKLRKQEKRLQERLQKAQEKHAKAQELLERAEARLQKRAAQVQHLQERLARVHAQELELPARSELQVTASEELPLASSFVENMLDTGFVTIIPPLSAQTAENAPATETLPASSESQPSPVAESSTSLAAQPSTETVPPAWQARAVAEVVEEEARAVVKRVREASLRLEEAESVEEIAEEEEQLEVGVTKTLAEAAAQAAAEAEAQAEASSVRTRKARIMARQADQELALIRASIRNGSLTGKEATLQAAEDKSTRAHAELADAEVAEERAIDAARNAEADAEVAEGMAFSAVDRFVDDIDSINDVDGQVVQAIAHQEEGQKKISTQPDDESEDDERTEQHPVIRPQGSA